MEHRLLAYKNSKLSYYRFGSGPRHVVCFHGYGEEASLYSFLEKYAGGQFTFYSIDLPFHGRTKWNEGLNFSHTDLQQIVRDILTEATWQRKTGNEKLILLGFSLGGRIALSLYQAQPENVDKIILLAPDGLKVNFWYWFSTQTWAGNKLFSFSMKYPGWFFTFLKAVNKLGLVNASVFKFVNYYIGNKEARQLLYQRWTGLRKLKPNLQKVKNLIRKYKTQTHLVYGKYDRIILPVRGEKFQKGIEEFCIVTVIASGHQVLHENHVEGIVTALQH
ncbi:MAG TPA: alpha/beta hydrolase [Chitinophagaceae bacterium]|nr:alpha/beta hydrolase [Chitinophagaceae bacterium]